METKRLIFAVLWTCLASVYAEEEFKDIYMQAATCPHRFHMGCMLDVVEKSCTGLQTIEGCAKKGKCKNVDELQRLVGALDPKNFEALNKCCCTKAFKEGGYEDCKNPDPVCKKAIADHVEKNMGNHLNVLKKCLKKPKKSTCKEAIDSAKWVSGAIQKARGEMWSVEGCKLLAQPEPVSSCGWDVKPTPRAIERADLYCDTIIWQFKEMGASDPFMSQCKDAPKAKMQAADSEGGEEEEEEEGLGEDADGGMQEKDKPEEAGDDLYSKASSCPHRKHMGCMLDVIEKSCETTREMLQCSKGKKCEKVEVKRFLAAMNDKSDTSLRSCCCPGMAYQKCKKPNDFCINSLSDKKPGDLASLLKIIKAYNKKAIKKNALEALKAVKEIRDSLQKARGEMWKIKGCEILAPMEPLIECGWNTGKQNVPIERKDLFCDTLMWQFKELGMYDEAMAECPNAPKVNPEDIPEEEASQDDMPQEEEDDGALLRDEL